MCEKDPCCNYIWLAEFYTLGYWFTKGGIFTPVLTSKTQSCGVPYHKKWSVSWKMHVSLLDISTLQGLFSTVLLLFKRQKRSCASLQDPVAMWNDSLSPGSSQAPMHFTSSRSLIMGIMELKLIVKGYFFSITILNMSYLPDLCTGFAQSVCLGSSSFSVPRLCSWSFLKWFIHFNPQRVKNSALRWNTSSPGDLPTLPRGKGMLHVNTLLLPIKTGAS